MIQTVRIQHDLRIQKRAAVLKGILHRRPVYFGKNIPGKIGVHIQQHSGNLPVPGRIPVLCLIIDGQQGIVLTSLYQSAGKLHIASRAELRSGLRIPVCRYHLHAERITILQLLPVSQGKLTDSVCETPDPIQLLRLPDKVIDSVSAEEFISCISGKRNRNLLPGKLRHQHGRNLGGIRHRLIEEPRQIRNKLQKILLPDDSLCMIRSEIFRDCRCIRRFIIVLFLKPDGKGLKRRASKLLLCDRTDQ